MFKVYRRPNMKFLAQNVFAIYVATEITFTSEDRYFYYIVNIVQENETKSLHQLF